MTKQPDDFLVKREKKDAEDHPAEEAQFTWFGPPDMEERFRFLVLRESGDEISILPGEGRFKKGLTAWRWDAAEDGEHETYLVLKTKHNRIDLRRMPEG